MTDWIFLLTPLLVLAIVLLFRFVGCGHLQGAPDDEPASSPTPAGPPKYRDSIMAEPNLVAYWRLVEADGLTAAKDEKGFHDAIYVTTSPIPDDPARKSQGAPGDFLFSGEAL